MKALTLWQPWASLVMLGAKEFETRSWATSHRGLLAIHAAKRWDHAMLSMSLVEPFRSALGWDDATTRAVALGLIRPTLGKVLGTVELVGCVRTEDVAIARPDISGWGRERAFGDWARGRYAWRLKNPLVFQKAIPARGFQRIWDWDSGCEACP